MEDMTFGDALETVQGRDGRYKALVPGNWLQGRAAFGGLAVAIGVRALLLDSGENRPLRSLMVSFVGPLGQGDCDVLVRPLRVGKSVAQYAIEITQGDAFVTQISAVFGAGREEKGLPGAVRNDLPPLEKYPVAPFVPGRMPNFVQYLNSRWCGNGMPMAGTDDLTLNMWTQLKHDTVGFEVERLVAIADVPPPVMLSHYTTPVVASSITWKLEFVQTPQEVETDWFHLDFALEGAQGGYSQQAGRIYDEQGRLLMLSHQCMAYFGGKSFG